MDSGWALSTQLSTAYVTALRSVAGAPFGMKKSGNARPRLRFKVARRFMAYEPGRNAVEQTRPFFYSVTMPPKTLIQQNAHLRNAQDYQRALRANVLSSTAIEGVKKAAERALAPAPGKLPAKKR